MPKIRHNSICVNLATVSISERKLFELFLENRVNKRRPDKIYRIRKLRHERFETGLIRIAIASKQFSLRGREDKK